MKSLFAILIAALGSGVVAIGFNASATAEAAPPAATELVVHEWGTFTSFSGADGVAVGFTPNNSDLPDFVYSEENPPDTKAARLARTGLISMETPVLYFYTPAEMQVSVKVGFPKGWITEWYPFAVAPPTPRGSNTSGQSICWNAKLMPGKNVTFPVEAEGSKHYYEARATDAAPLEVEAEKFDSRRNPALRGGSVVQREKFLFYRGVGTFPPLVTVKAAGGEQVTVKNSSRHKLGGLVLVNVRDGKIGYRYINDLNAGAETFATIPPANGSRNELTVDLVKQLTAAGLYEKEAKAMVRTWEHAWFGEPGTRVIYLVPPTKTDELLPLTVTPTPKETARVLVGRHDFLTPEQEAVIDKQLARIRAARAELNAAEGELGQVGRFVEQARQQAEKRSNQRAGSPR